MITFIILLGFLLFLYNYKNQFKQFFVCFQFAKIIPGPPFYELGKQNSKTFLRWIDECSKEYGPIFRIWLGKDVFVFVSNAEHAKTMLGSNELLHKDYFTLRPWLRNGLLTNVGRNWHQRRKLLTPSFHFKILGSFKEPMERKCDILIDKLNKVSDGRSIDIYQYITLFALDVISETAMGVDQHVQENSESKFVQSTQSICRLLHQQGFSLWMRFPFLYYFSDNKKKRDQVLSFLHGETKRVIKQRREILEKTNIDIESETNTDEFGIKHRLAFLDMLLITQMNGADLTDENIEEEVDTFMFEGHDTTSSAISFAIYLLSKYPDAQQIAYEEAVEFEGKEADTMKYLEAVIKETLRLYPSVPMYSRLLVEPFVMGEYTIPSGCLIALAAHTLHRDPELFPNPNVFQPERFLGNQEYHPYAFAAFSAGPRNCIGQKFAMLELKSSLAKLLRAFEFQPVEGFEPLLVHDLILKSSIGIQIRLKKR